MFLRSKIALHMIGPVTLISILIAVFTKGRKLDLFSLFDFFYLSSFKAVLSHVFGACMNVISLDHVYSHPLCMSFGFLFFLTEGLLCYNDGSLPQALFPIMKGPSRSLEAQTRKTRVVHRSLQIMGTILILLGLSFVLAHKIRESGKAHRLTGETSSLWHLFPHSWHGWMGLITILVLVAQSVSGVVKV